MDTLINTSTFYQKMMEPLLVQLSLPACIFLVLLGLTLLGAGYKLGRVSFVFNGIFLGAAIGYVVGTRFNMDPWLAMGIPALLLGVGGGFLKTTYTAITCAIGFAVFVIFAMMNWNNAFDLGQLYLVAIIVAVIAGALSFIACHHLVILSTSSEGAMLLLVVACYIIHGGGEQASATYVSMSQSHAFFPLILYIVVVSAGTILQLVTSSHVSKR